jgi:hypothetical protein
MHEFTAEETRRWQAWQQANVIVAQRTDHMARLFAMAMLASTLAAVVITLLRR